MPSDNAVKIRRSSSVDLPWKGNLTLRDLQAFCEAALAEGADPLDTVMPSMGTVPGDRPGLSESTITGLHVNIERVL